VSGWASVTDLCQRVLARLPELAEATTSRIRQDLSDYGAVPPAEHLAAVTDQLHRRLRAIADRRPLDGSDLENAARLAERRARQGVSVDVLIGAYHIGDRELWRMLSADPGAAAPLLPEVGALMFESLHATSTVLAGTHGDVARQLQSHRITLSQRLVELLSAGDSSAEAERVGHALGFDPEGRFVALVWRPERPQLGLTAELQRELDRQPGVVAYSYQQTEAVLVAQGAPDLAGLAERYLTDGVVGIGLERSSVRGAAESLADARLALAAASTGHRVLNFGEVWIDACVLSQAARLRPLVADAVGIARAHPHIAEAVLAFAGASMSIADTARAMHLHANTITYRLDRWAHLVGWNPRTFDGLVRSVVSCRLATR
jgi:hypothetical protein